MEMAAKEVMKKRSTGISNIIRKAPREPERKRKTRAAGETVGVSRYG
jgi:hypothetical protein